MGTDFPPELVLGPAKGRTRVRSPLRRAKEGRTRSRTRNKYSMSRIAYVNGRYLPRAQAKVSVEDRGYQFADGVYEVCEVRGGRLIDERRHMARLDLSLNELRIARPMSPDALSIVLWETVRRNRVRDGIVYLQITRGVAHAVAPHGFPQHDRERGRRHRTRNAQFIQREIEPRHMTALIDQAPSPHLAHLVDAVGKLIAAVLDRDFCLRARQVASIDIGDA